MLELVRAILTVERFSNFRVHLVINNKGYKYTGKSNGLVNFSYYKYSETIEEAKKLFIDKFILMLVIQNDAILTSHMMNEFTADIVDNNYKVITILKKIKL